MRHFDSSAILVAKCVDTEKCGGVQLDGGRRFPRFDFMMRKRHVASCNDAVGYFGDMRVVLQLKGIFYPGDSFGVRDELKWQIVFMRPANTVAGRFRHTHP